MPATSKPSFPEDAWNSRLFAQYRQLVGPTTEAPDPFLWGAFAGAFSFLLGRDARFAWGTGFQVPTLLIALVGTTGKARKSTAIDDVISVIVDPLRARGGDGMSDPTDVVVGSGSGEGFAASLSDKRFTARDGLDEDS